MRPALLLLVVEKIVQHGLTAMFFLVYIEGIGTPDIGPWMPVSNSVMAILNGTLATLFLIVIFLIPKRVVPGLNLAMTLAGADIVAEVVFHGIGYVTVSVVVALLIIALSLYWKRMIHQGEGDSKGP